MTPLSDEGSLLHAPSSQEYTSLTRHASSYASLPSFELPKERTYKQQFGDMYFLRLAVLKPIVERLAADAWDGVQIAGETVHRVERVLDVRQGQLCWVIGTVYMEMTLKPNILEDISKDQWISAPTAKGKYTSSDGTDLLMLEDDSGRLRLVGTALVSEMLVTGCIIAVMGTENVNGDFDVVDIKVPDLPPQPERWSISKQSENGASTKIEGNDVVMDDSMEGNKPILSKPGPKIAIVSGLSFSGDRTDRSIELDLLVEFLLGEALDPTTQQNVSQITRLIIAGNSTRSQIDMAAAAAAIDLTNTGTTRKAQKKYGYDSSAYNPAPTAHLDGFLASLLPSLPVTLIPGASDPANVSLPQQPIHAAMFPQARAYGSGGVPIGTDAAAKPKKIDTSEPGWFDAVTNPWEGEVEGWRVLGTGGQNIDDVFKYVDTEDRLGMLEAMCRWRCCAPTAPDTLWSYPFQTHDPFVLKACPHIFFAGSQPKFDTASIEGPDGQTVRLIAVPSFSETCELVLVDVETLEAEVVSFKQS